MTDINKTHVEKVTHEVFDKLSEEERTAVLDVMLVFAKAGLDIEAGQRVLATTMAYTLEK